MRANLYMVIFTTHFLSSLISARQIFDRIVNGQAATQGQFPYQVSMCYNHTASFNQAICDTQCGGSIFNETTIITAAHCCWDSWVDYPSRYMIVAGELDSVHTSGLEQFRTVKSIKIHPNYNSNVFPYNQHDISFACSHWTHHWCLMKMLTEYTLMKKIQWLIQPVKYQDGVNIL